MTHDATLMFGTSPPSASFNLHSSGMFSPHHSGTESDSGIYCRSPPTTTRRIKTYPPEYMNPYTSNPLRIFMASSLKNRCSSDSAHLHTIYTPPPSATDMPTEISTTPNFDEVRRQLQCMTTTPSTSTTTITLQPPPTKCHNYDIHAKDEVELRHHSSSPTPRPRSVVKVESPPPSPKLPARKRTVRFADDEGMQLEEIRYMTEPSDCPPKLDISVLRGILGDEHFAEPSTAATWQLAFAQPAGDYVKFRQTLDETNVALENVLLKNDECQMTGTVRVKNVSFEKSVFIRYTDNNWLSYYDRVCTYKPNRLGDPAYDTFTFTVDIPKDDEQHEHISFCVCYKTGGTNEPAEFWDSNGGSNYSIMSAERKRRMESNTKLSSPVRKAPDIDSLSDMPRTSDAWNLNMGSSWGNFSSWKNLKTDTPYY